MARALVQATTAPVWVVGADAADTFAETVYDLVRRLPLVLVSVSHHRGDRPLIDPALLKQQLGDLAEVAVLADDAASWALSERLPKLSAWGGAIRVYFPDARESDPWQRHPLIRIDPRRPAIAVAQAVARIRAAAGLPAVAPTPLASVPTPRPTSENNVTPKAPASDSAERQRADAETARLAAQLAERERVVADKERLLREKDATIAELRQQVQKLTKQLRTADRAADAPGTAVVFADPERQFRHEVELQFLRSIPEPERETYPLAAYRLGRDWLTSLEKIELVDRRKIVEVAVEVLTGRAVDSAARRLRRMRNGSGGASPRIREDGAVAWRCDIKHGTASAPRLMYWKLTDGHTIELGRAAAHDDMALR